MAVYAGGLLMTLLLVQKAAPVLGFSGETGRKSIHMLSGAAVLTTPIFFSSATPLVVLALLYAGINAWSRKTGAFSAINDIGRASLGTVIYPLAFAALLLLFWEKYTPVWMIAFAIMAFGDAAAGLAGSRAPDADKLPLPWDKKSRRGTLTMLAVSILITGGGLLIFSDALRLGIWSVLGLAGSIGLVSSAAEALSWRGSDNFSVPFFSALLLYAALYLELLPAVVYGTFLAFLLGVFAYRARALDLSGSMAAFLSGTVIFGLGGWVYSIPVLVFFITSSLLSHLPGEKKSQPVPDAGTGARRNVVQVLSNGLVATLMVPAMFWLPQPLAFLIFLSALAAATADTWATEIGRRYGRTPRSIITGEFVDVDTSGGVTPIGLSAALLGAGAVAFVGILTYNFFSDQSLSLRAIFFVIAAGYVGQLVDSLLGAAVQLKLRCSVCGQLVETREHCGKPAVQVAGWSWMDNDLVNLFCTLAGAVFPVIILYGFGIQL